MGKVDKTFGEPLPKLRAVPIEENGEPLIDPRRLSRRIHFAAVHPKFAGMSRSPKVRQRVAEMLAEAAESLPPGIDLKMIEGFRTMEHQWHEYHTLEKEFREQRPDWDDDQLRTELHAVSAPPDDPSPPPHTTGGAVDLTLVRVTTNRYLDMTSPFAWGDESAPTDFPDISEAAQANRRLLIDTLSRAGLTNYAGEWWHWSYGDSGWALRVGAPCAVYGRLPDAG